MLKKHYFFMLTVCASLLLFTACTLEKKLYSKGYHIEWKTRLKANDKAPETIVFEAPDQTKIAKAKTLGNGSDSLKVLTSNIDVEKKQITEQVENSPSNAQEGKSSTSSTFRTQTDKRSLVKKDVSKGPQKDQKKPNYALYVSLFIIFALALVLLILISTTSAVDVFAILGYGLLLFFLLMITLVILFAVGAVDSINKTNERKKKEQAEAEEDEQEVEEEKKEDRPLTEEEQFLKDLEESKTPAYKKRRRTQIVMGFFIAFIVTFLLLVSQ